MQHVFPDYYKEFRCISSQCQHNCCIGWEIDIDPDTADSYSTVSGEFGQRLRRSISDENEPHFILGKDERCPFLNDRNLCDIITSLGEEHLCTICAEHPRFHNELPGRIESGLGLCCEEAARLILGRKEPVKLEVTGECECEDMIVAMRDDIIAMLQDRSMTIPERIEEMLCFCGDEFPERSIGDWAKFLCGLERLDDTWTALLEMFVQQNDKLDYAGFDRYMADRQTEYEQLMVYMIYRHAVSAPTILHVEPRIKLAVLTYMIIRALGAMTWSSTGAFTFEQQAELARMFSSEIEYSDENLYILFNELDVTDI